MRSTLLTSPVLNSEPAPAQVQTLGVLALALSTRLLVLWAVVAQYPPRWFFVRGVEMELLAKSFLAGQGLSSPFGGSTGPTAFIAPAYPLLVAAVFRVFGVDTLASEIVLIFGQITLNLVSVWLILHLAERLFDRGTALVAGVFWACSPPLIWLPTILWETSISICMLLGLIALALKFREHSTRGMALLLGVHCGVAAHFNPALLVVLVAVAGWIAYQTWHNARYILPLAALTFLIVFSPWPIRNARVFHRFIPLRTTVGLELWMGNRDGATGYLDESIFPMYNSQELSAYRSMGEVAYTHQKAALAKQYIAAHPAEFIRMSVVRLFRFWCGTGTRQGSPLFWMHALITTLPGILGLAMLFKRRRYGLGILMALPLLLFPLPYYITHAEFRYRLVIDPLLTLLAAYAIVAAWRALASRESRAQQNV